MQNVATGVDNRLGLKVTKGHRNVTIQESA